MVLFVEPSADPVLAGIGNEVWETADTSSTPSNQIACHRYGEAFSHGLARKRTD
jgi:hypothetical protein